jgi:low temperature requirement protein LtrA
VDRERARVGAADAEQVRVSTVELFFDLVFVFTITQLTSAAWSPRCSA